MTAAQQIAPVAAPARQRVIVVLGAGRSGTSVLTRGLGTLGVELGDRLKPATRKNAKGFFEDQDFIAINYRLRDVFGFKRSGAGVQAVPQAWFERPEIEPIFADAVGSIRTRFAGAGTWGFKAGGVLGFLPFWERVFAAAEQDPHYVLALRNPLSVALSRARVSLRRGLQANSDLEFLGRVVPYFRLAAKRPLVVVDYDRLMDDAKAELTRLALTFDIAITPDVQAGIDTYAGEFLSQGLRHHDYSEADLRADEHVVPLARDAYLLLAAVARGERTLVSVSFWEDWARIERAHADMAPLLRHIDTLEADLRRSREGVAGALLLAGDLIRKWRLERRGNAGERG